MVRKLVQHLVQTMLGPLIKAVFCLNFDTVSEAQYQIGRGVSCVLHRYKLE